MQFANSKKRMIQMSDKGVPFVMTAAGKKSYKPVAAFKKNANGSLVKLQNTNNVPNAIKPKAMKKPSYANMVKKSNATPKPRATRSNKGKAREGTAERKAAAMFNAPKARKVRSNKGVKRGPREGTAERKAAAMFNAPKARKVRSNKGVRRVMPKTAKAQMKAGLTPTEEALFAAIFNEPVRKVRSNAGVKRGPREGTAERKAAAMFNAPKARKVRSNAGVKRGPRTPREGNAERKAAAMFNRPAKKASKPKTAKAQMRAGLTPEEGLLYQLIFNEKPPRKVRSNKGVKRGPRKAKA